uniref:Par-3 family cell polarity regulator beta n=1 Tax=Leptobrachium leishanense TaxID=445787 RepID=A0A8C5PCR6_9ANUR
MKVTVCFGNTGIVVPCKDGRLSVKELIQQAAQRFIKAREKEPGYWVKIHHLEYRDGGILDPDDLVADVAEDKDKLIAVFDEYDANSRNRGSPANADRLSPDPFEAELTAQLPAFQPHRGEIEVTPSALKLGTPLLVRRSSDPTLGPVADFRPGPINSAESNSKLSVQAPSKGLTGEEQNNHPWQEEHLRYHRFRNDDSELTRKVEISGDGGPLGIHVVPYYSACERSLGLYIRGIEESSRSRREGLFQENECIVKINNVNLMNRSFTHAQEIFRQAMKHQSVLVEVVPPQNKELYEKAVISSMQLSDDEGDDDMPNIKPPPPSAQGKLRVKMADQANGLESTEMTFMQFPPAMDLSQSGKFSPPSLSPLGFGNKKNAKKLKIDLRKGVEGLGFTVVTRDSTVHGPGPIFVKNILPKGAAIKDGRLLSGDRILEVNGIDIAGKTQEELVAMLRSTKLGETVSMVIARPDDGFLPRELKGETDYHIFPPDNTAQMTFEIPLNDSGSAGLGISLKGNKSRDTQTDLGIFIKSIIHGGAAFKDGRLRVNDQLLAVNGESLLGKSNREAMETLRRSMSMEGNIRGMIQLVIHRRLDRQTEDRLDIGPSVRASLENSPLAEQNGVPERKKDYMFHEGNPEKAAPPPIPPHPKEHIIIEYSKFSSGEESSQQPESVNLKSSRSMDLVFSEKDLGPRLGLKKSSSLESLQTAVAEVKKNELPFYRPRPHMVRGRGCNESFRAAIDKSYDGPEEEEDRLSDVSSHSGRETPSSESAPLGIPSVEAADKAKKEKKKKDKRKDNEKEKGKNKAKDKNKKEEIEEQEKKAKKKGLGAMLRFGKKKDDKGGKTDQKSISKPATVKEEENDVEKMKEERERINSKRQEIREKQARMLWDLNAGHDMEDDEVDPSYARVINFRDGPPHQNAHRPYSPQITGVHLRDTQAQVSERDHVQDLYSKINKKQQVPDAADSGRSTSGNADRIQQLRMEYHQARRDGFALYEEESRMERPLDYDQNWVPSRVPDGSRNRYEGMERQYASLPRRGPMEPIEYMSGPHTMYKERDPPIYYDVTQPSQTSRGTYSRTQAHQDDNYRFPPYPTPSTKGPLRQDVPPSPVPRQRVPGYGSGGRPGEDRYQYRPQDPRQKNPMTAAV